MKKSMIMFCISAMVAVTACNNSANSGSTGKQTDSSADSTKKAAYQCPMDCEKGKTYDQPGKCPVCEMDLEKVK